MQIIFLALFIPFPGAEAERSQPIAGRLTFARCIVHFTRMPYVKVLEARFAIHRFLEPFVLVARMIRNEIQNEPNTELVTLGRQPLEIRHGSIFWLDITKIGNVIAEVDHW